MGSRNKEESEDKRNTNVRNKEISDMRMVCNCRRYNGGIWAIKPTNILPLLLRRKQKGSFISYQKHLQSNLSIYISSNQSIYHPKGCTKTLYSSVSTVSDKIFCKPYFFRMPYFFMSDLRPRFPPWIVWNISKRFCRRILFAQTAPGRSGNADTSTSLFASSLAHSLQKYILTNWKYAFKGERNAH